MIVSNATALVLFARIGRLSLLHDVLRELVIPQAVADELAVSGKAGAAEVQATDWIRVVAVQDRDRIEQLPAHLGRGEREAIALAKELNWAQRCSQTTVLPGGWRRSRACR